MQTISDNFRALSHARSREIEVKIIVGDMTRVGRNRTWTDSRTYYGDDSVISLNFGNGKTSGGFEIGLTVCKTLELKVKSSANIATNARLKPFVKFGNAEWIQMGEFYVDSVTAGTLSKKITAMDKMIQLEKNYVSALTFPAMLSDVANEIFTANDIETADGFELLYDTWVIEFPTRGCNSDGKIIYYTRREIIGYIAALSGANAFFDGTGKLNFTSFAETNETIPAENCLSQTFSGDIYEIMQVYWNDSGIPVAYNDDYEPHETIEFSCPLNVRGKTQINAALTEKLVGLSYSPATISAQGFGYFEYGDKISVVNSDGDTFAIVLHGITQTFSGGGFTAVYYSLAYTDSQSNYANQSSNRTANELDANAVVACVSERAVTVTTTYAETVRMYLSTVSGSLPIAMFTATVTVSGLPETADADTSQISGVRVTAALYLGEIEMFTMFVVAELNGNHTISGSFPLIAIMNGTHDVSIRVKKSHTNLPDGATVIIPSGGANLIIHGRGIANYSMFSGLIEAAEEIDTVAIAQETAIALGTISETGTISAVAPETATAANVVSAVGITAPTLLGADSISENIILQPVPTADYTNYTTIVITFANAVTASGGFTLAAFSASGTVSGVVTAISISAAAMTAEKTLTLTVSDFSGFDGSIQVNYDSSIGNMVNVLDGTATGSFSVSFVKN